MIELFQCCACTELLYEPIILPCNQLCCRRCFRIPKSITKEFSTSQSIGAYNCPSKNCKQIHRFRNESPICGLQTILEKLFPSEQRALLICKQGEEILAELRRTNLDLHIPCTELSRLLDGYFVPASELAPTLQLPLILKSKILGELGHFKQARMFSQRANTLNPGNKRGIVSEKLVDCMEEMRSTKKCILNETRKQLRQFCGAISFGEQKVPSTELLEKQLEQTLSNLSIDDLECQLCLEHFVEPIVTPCGHVYCRSCLVNSLDQSRCCPLCRTILPTMGYFVNKTVFPLYSYFLDEYFNIPKQTREISIFKPYWIAIHYCPLMFPTSSGQLHFCEPQERVMIKRVIEGNMKFGVMIPQVGNTEIEFGTLLKIESFEPLLGCDIIPTIDGNLPRCVVQVHGVSKFKVINTRLNDGGYTEGLVVRVEDEEIDQEEWDPRAVESLVQKARQFIIKLMESIPDTARLHLERKHGVMPLDPVELSYWLAELLPLNHYVLYKLLPMTNVQSRLEQLCEWLQTACGCLD